STGSMSSTANANPMNTRVGRAITTPLRVGSRIPTHGSLPTQFSNSKSVRSSDPREGEGGHVMPADTATEAVLAANDSFYRAFNQRDLEAMDMLWSHSSEITCIHPGWNLLSGREDVMESWEAIMSNPAQP